MSKMTVIQLLNKIANGEHDFKFKYCDLEYFWDFSSKAFIDTESKMTLGERWEIDNILNDEVEVIEEDKKIEKLKIEQDTPNSNFYIRNENGTKCGLTKHSKIIADKINEIIDKINKGE